MGIRRSPRKLLKTALDPLETLEELFERYPEARTQLEAEIGGQRVADLALAREAVRQAVEMLDAERPRRD